jgi:hypothetical protein
MKPFNTPLRLLTLPAWLVSRPARNRRDPALDSSLDTMLWHDTEPKAPPALGTPPGRPPAPLSRDEIESALDAGTQRHFPPRPDTEIMRGH